MEVVQDRVGAVALCRQEHSLDGVEGGGQRGEVVAVPPGGQQPLRVGAECPDPARLLAALQHRADDRDEVADRRGREEQAAQPRKIDGELCAGADRSEVPRPTVETEKPAT